MAHSYLPLLVMFVLAGIVVVSLLFIAEKLGPKRTSAVKEDPFESGNPPLGDARVQFPVKFYLVAMLFLIFDIEIVFIYPWAILVRHLGWFGLAAMGIFLSVLIIALIYEWKKGALEWE